MIYGPRPIKKPVFTSNNKEIDICDSYKYLGVVFDSVQILRSNIFKEMINYTCDKARKAGFVTHKKCKTIGICWRYLVQWNRMHRVRGSNAIIETCAWCEI